MACAAAATWSVAQPAVAGTASFAPSPGAVTAGSSVTLTLDDTLPPVDPVLGGVAGVDLTVTFDPTVLSFSGAGLGSLLTGWTAPIFSSGGSGIEDISVAECGLCSDAGGAGSVITLTFTALAADATAPTNISAQTASVDVGVPNEYQLPSVTGAINVTAASSLPAPGFPLLGLPVLLMVRRAWRRT